MIDDDQEKRNFIQHSEPDESEEEKMRLDQQIVTLSSLFDSLTKITEGSFGRVYCATKLGFSKKFAIKIFKGTAEPTSLTTSIVREVVFLKMLRHHPKVVRFINFEWWKDVYFLSLELENQTLSEFVNGKEWDLAYVEQLHGEIVSAIAHLHKLDAMHRDLKPSNCLVTKEVSIRLIDFGTACFYIPGRSYTLDCTTVWYRSPEMLMEFDGYDQSVDDWAIGCIRFYLLSNGESPFIAYNNKDLWKSILSRVGPLSETLCRSLEKRWPKMAGVDMGSALRNRQSVNARVDIRDEETWDWLRLDPKCRKKSVNYLQGDWFANNELKKEDDLQPLYLFSRHSETTPHDDTTLYENHEINMNMRRILLRWLLQVRKKFKASLETYLGAVQLIDGRLSGVPPVTKAKFQLLGIAAMSVSAKTMGAGFLAEDLVYICSGAITEEELLEEEGNLVVGSPGLDVSPHRQLEPLLKDTDSPSRVEYVSSIVALLTIEGRYPRTNEECGMIWSLCREFNSIEEGIRVGNRIALSLSTCKLNDAPD